MDLSLFNNLLPVFLMFMSVSMAALAGFLIARAVYAANTAPADASVLQSELARMRRRTTAAEVQKAALQTEVERTRRRMRRI